VKNRDVNPLQGRQSSGRHDCMGPHLVDFLNASGYPQYRIRGPLVFHAQTIFLSMARAPRVELHKLALLICSCAIALEPYASKDRTGVCHKCIGVLDYELLQVGHDVLLRTRDRRVNLCE
jgi:hypothetical protein